MSNISHSVMFLRVLLPSAKFPFPIDWVMQMSPSRSCPHQLETSSELIDELKSLADQNERRSLIATGAIAVVTAILLPMVALQLGVKVTDRSFSFWFGGLIAELLIVFAVWYGAVLWIAPPRSNMQKMLEAIKFAASNPISVSLSQSGQQVTIYLPEEHVVLTGAAAITTRSSRWFSISVRMQAMAS